ncbi:MAG: hypothetical protein OXG57_06775 [Acidimicrobiaceae bacterium]|nr:hypothetical protein [Acidimicrobiaceae bacterium]
MEGVVGSDLEAGFALTLRGPSGIIREVDVIVDTGFSGYLTNPPGLASALALPQQGIGESLLAYGRITHFPYFAGGVMWDDHYLAIEIDAAETTPLVGMRLLHGYRLCADVYDGGRLTIERLP